MRSKRMLQILALVVVLSMIFTTAAFAVPGFDKNNNRERERHELNIKDYENALRALIRKEIVKGYGNGDYGLSGNVKRADVIVMIVRVLEQNDLIDWDDYDEEDIIEFFEDVKEDEYFFTSLKIAKKLNIAKGDGKFFNPNRPVTVQEVIWLIERAMTTIDKNFDSDIIDELEKIYESELNDFAKRQDVFWMIYYVLDIEKTDDEIELEVITMDMEDNTQLNFEDDWFEDKFNGDDDDLEYIKLNLPEKGGKLYYDYDEDANKNTLVSEKIKYYFGDDEDNIIEEISFVPNDNFKGIVTIEYTAYTEDESYEGLIKITVDYNTLKVVTFEVDENKQVSFDEDKFASYIDEVKFDLPDNKTGTLYYDDDKDGKPESDEAISRRTLFKRDQLDNIIFKPYENFKGVTVFEYTAFDYEDDELDRTYYGEIKITVEGVLEVPKIDLEADYNDEYINIYLLDELEDIIDDDEPFDIDDVDYVKFEIPEEGTLKIKIEDNSLMNVDDENSYELDEIEYLRYIFDDDEEIEINYTVYDEKTNSIVEYEGLITINID